MKYFIMIVLAFMMVGCAASDGTDAKTLLQTLEFEGEEYGSIKATGSIKVGTVPFFSSEIHIDYEKTKDAPVYEVVE
jgi:uncharacterized protein YcfL